MGAPCQCGIEGRFLSKALEVHIQFFLLLWIVSNDGLFSKVMYCSSNASKEDSECDVAEQDV